MVPTHTMNIGVIRKIAPCNPMENTFPKNLYAVKPWSSNWQSWVLRETMEISLAIKDILNQEAGLPLSKTWMPDLKLCKKD